MASQPQATDDWEVRSSRKTTLSPKTDQHAKPRKTEPVQKARKATLDHTKSDNRFVALEDHAQKTRPNPSKKAQNKGQKKKGTTPASDVGKGGKSDARKAQSANPIGGKIQGSRRISQETGIAHVTKGSGQLRFRSYTKDMQSLNTIKRPNKFTPFDVNAPLEDIVSVLLPEKNIFYMELERGEKGRLSTLISSATDTETSGAAAEALSSILRRIPQQSARSTKSRPVEAVDYCFPERLVVEAACGKGRGLMNAAMMRVLSGEHLETRLASPGEVRIRVLVELVRVIQVLEDAELAMRVFELLRESCNPMEGLKQYSVQIEGVLAKVVSDALDSEDVTPMMWRMVCDFLTVKDRWSDLILSFAKIDTRKHLGYRDLIKALPGSLDRLTKTCAGRADEKGLLLTLEGDKSCLEPFYKYLAPNLKFSPQFQAEFGRKLCGQKAGAGRAQGVKCPGNCATGACKCTLGSVALLGTEVLLAMATLFCAVLILNENSK